MKTEILEIQEQLKNHKDEKYAEFMRRLMPGLETSEVLGVRTPVLKKMAKQIKREGGHGAFLAQLPHTYFEENQLHGFLVSEMTDFADCIRELERFLPFVDNWATCDQTSPRIFKKHKAELIPYIDKWLKSGHVYTVRFAIGMLMQHYLDEDFKEEYLEKVSGVRSEEYYVNMEIAWYMATALAKQWDAAIPYIEGARMEKWVHNRTIQKARESYRITPEQKEYLKAFRR
jgi:3-methyladenine DNA glycosylase AlkD